MKKGDVVKFEGDPHIVETIKVQSPSARGAVTLYKIRFRNLKSKRKVEQALRGDDILAEGSIEEALSYLEKNVRSPRFQQFQPFGFYGLLDNNWPAPMRRKVTSTGPSPSTSGWSHPTLK